MVRLAHNHKVDLLKLCKKLSKKKRKTQIAVVDGMCHNTIHLISEIFKNMTFLTQFAPPKLKEKIIYGMPRNADECKYISKINGLIKTKRIYIKNQIGTGLFSMILSAAIPILTSFINSFTK